MNTQPVVGFTVDDICKLMSSAHEHGVSEFHCGGLDFKLVNDPFIRAALPTNKTATVKPNIDFDSLLIEDPLAFEDAMRMID
jgi:hypothetical protein